MAKLYEIAQNIMQLEELLEQMDDGDLTFDSVKEYLDSLVDIDLSHKVENIVKYIKNLEADADMYKAEKQRLDKLEKSSNKKAEGLKDYLSEILSGIGYDYKNKKTIKTSVANVSFKKLPPKLEIMNIDKVPAEWDKPVKREVRSAELLKYAKEIAGDFKDKDEVQLQTLGVKIINNNSSLQIK